MGISKRDFLKIWGLAFLGIGARPAASAIGGAGETYPDPEAETASRLAMVVNPAKCKEGCTECMDRCHYLHNVPDFVNNANDKVNNARHEIKWIWTESYGHVFDVPEKEVEYVSEKLRRMPIVTLCNHCDNPPCVRVCPTQATFKRKDGVVMMDFHRCIGCRFCMAGCPYGSRSFNFKDPRLGLDAPGINREFPTRMKGVVEKCNFCAERLAVGKIPACVEACPEGALVFGDLKDEDTQVSKILRDNFTIKRKPELGTMPMVYYVV